jgi:hypothetical protein
MVVDATQKSSDVDPSMTGKGGSNFSVFVLSLLFQSVIQIEYSKI